MKKTYIKPTSKTVVLKSRAALLSGSNFETYEKDAKSTGDFYDDPE